MHLLSRHADTGLRCVFQDDGRVGWAWLEDWRGEPMADVWLYNRAPAPAALELGSPPALNAAPLCRPLEEPFPTSPDELTVTWRQDGELLLADVLLRGRLLGRLSPGAQPGWARLAVQAGPLALPLE